jgi:predicted enzyme related to lactoylglutathione lyase
MMFMAFKNAISWFEIPAIDVDKAQRFYEYIFSIKLIPLDMGEFKMRMFPLENQMEGIGGAICLAKEFYIPSAINGPLLYLNADPDLQNVLEKVEAAGGKITIPKRQISPEYGFMAVFIDSEGNRIALHSIA